MFSTPRVNLPRTNRIRMRPLAQGAVSTKSFYRPSACHPFVTYWSSAADGVKFARPTETGSAARGCHPYINFNRSPQLLVLSGTQLNRRYRSSLSTMASTEEQPKITLYWYVKLPRSSASPPALSPPPPSTRSNRLVPCTGSRTLEPSGYYGFSRSSASSTS